ncbi:hypothetical protein SUDANB58_00616 [Streptomyces sp. enrichment culture]
MPLDGAPSLRLPGPEGLVRALLDTVADTLPRFPAAPLAAGSGAHAAPEPLHLHQQTDASAAGPTLVVCPTSPMGNWQREIGKFAPGTPVRRFHGTRRDLEDLPTASSSSRPTARWGWTRGGSPRCAGAW